MSMSVFQRARLSRRPNEPAAIFVHAGAGYHSVQNESVHLQACNDATTAAMALLRSGATAVEAVEMAIKVLEDREITNAGYGSNLAIDGAVEGDAIVIDHLGRSGGCGAVPNIKNPISLARTILEMSSQELSLRRVPPNLLVGQGAVDFAFEHHIPILPNDALVSPAAYERWMRWKVDLKNAEKKAQQHRSPQMSSPSAAHSLVMVEAEPPPGYDELAERRSRDHVAALGAGMWNEGQPPTPVPSGHRPAVPTQSRMRQTTYAANVDPNTRILRPRPCSTCSQESIVDSSVRLDPASHDIFEHRRPSDLLSSADATMSDAEEPESQLRLSAELPTDQGSDDNLSSPSVLSLPPESPSLSSLTAQQDLLASNLPRDASHDHITDTVGAIAIDADGNIACGASSGGIGMKYRGRVGPAALVGVGAAVVPVEPEDKARTCTAAVTSGTGEHMGTTLAASVCAERLYHGQRKKRGGGFEPADDDQAIRAMIEHDFMEHPGVRYSHSSGAIGVLAVKKAANGIYVYFAHNTDSFALASMHADEPKPTCTMSRSPGNGVVAGGGRAIRYRKRR